MSKLKVGDVISGYEIVDIKRRFAYGVNPSKKCTRPYMIWIITEDGCAVYSAYDFWCEEVAIGLFSYLCRNRNEGDEHNG